MIRLIKLRKKVSKNSGKIGIKVAKIPRKREVENLRIDAYNTRIWIEKRDLAIKLLISSPKSTIIRERRRDGDGDWREKKWRSRG